METDVWADKPTYAGDCYARLKLSHRDVVDSAISQDYLYFLREKFYEAVAIETWAIQNIVNEKFRGGAPYLYADLVALI